MSKLLKYLPAFILIILVFQCSKNSTDPIPPRQLTLGETQVTESANGFGFKLFREIVRESSDENIFISPLSVSMALGMTYNGAAGSTREAMDSTLELSGMDIQEVNESYQSLIDLLVNLDPVVTFQIANSIWYRLGFPIAQDFVDLNQTYFYAEVNETDFSDPVSVDIINGWVDEATNGKIEEIIDGPIDPYTVMFLINAIYFNADWTYRFNEEDTHDDMFNLPDGTQSPCRMMTRECDLQYFETDDFQTIDLPYGYGLYSMTIFLPRNQVDIDTLISQINQQNWNDWINSFSEQEVTLSLPKFKLEYELELNDALSAIGMAIAFDQDEADFSGMRDPESIAIGNLFINKVKHKTFIRVDEEGTEAAAVTSVEIGETSINDISMRIDRPFIFVIRENHSQTILFMGKIVQPVWE